MKKIKLPLEMANGVLVRTLDELKENWDLEKVLNYYLNGKLQTWLTDRYYTELAEEVSALNGINDNAELQKKLCGIFGIEAEDDLVDMEAVAEHNRRLEILRQYTADDAVLKNVDKVAFNQEELADLLDEGEDVIYLCDNKFSVPLSVTGKKYIGLGDVEIQVNSKDFVDFVKIGIELVNVHFNKEYEELVNSNVVLYKKGEELEAAEKYTEALEMYKKAGAMGNSEGLFKVGKFYSEGRTGIEINYELARQYYEKAVSLNNPKAMNNLANMYANGEGGLKDISKAMELYKDAADLGSSAAMYNLAYRYHYGNEVEQNYSEAIKWYQKAAEKGNAEAMGNIGNLYLNGEGVNQNYEEALKWFRKGAEKGEAWIIGNVGHMYHYGNGVKQDYVEAMKWYQKAAEGGNAFSMNRIGDLYYYGNGVKQDYMEAMKWYRKAADYNFTEAINNIAWLYTYGQGVEKDYKEALEWYNKGAKLGNLFSCKRIADFYYNGTGVEKNYEEALKWYEKAKEKACYDIGWMYEFGQGTDKNVDTALSYYKKAVENGHYNEDYKWDSAFRYANILFKNNRENDALEFLANTYNDQKKQTFLKKIDDRINELSFPYTSFWISTTGWVNGSSERDAFNELVKEVQNNLNDFLKDAEKKINESTNEFLSKVADLSNHILMGKSICGQTVSQNFKNIQNMIKNDIQVIDHDIKIPGASTIAGYYELRTTDEHINTGSWLNPSYMYITDYKGPDIAENARKEFSQRTNELVDKVKNILHNEIISK